MPGFPVDGHIYCIHLHIHMCTVYKVPLWSLSLILVRGTFSFFSFLFYVLTVIMYILVFYIPIKVIIETSSVTSTAVLCCSENSIVFLKGTPKIGNM